MDEQNIRERIRSKLASGHLKQHDGMIVAGALRNREPCTACGLAIDPADAMPYGHAYSSGTHWFHTACHALWDDEAQPKIPRGDLAWRRRARA